RKEMRVTSAWAKAHSSRSERAGRATRLCPPYGARLDTAVPRLCNRRHALKTIDHFREAEMLAKTCARLAGTALAAALLLGAGRALAQQKSIKIGVVYDYSGPLAAGGSELHGLGTKIMLDYFNSKGGVEGYKLEPVYADAQSKPDTAINE